MGKCSSCGRHGMFLATDPKTGRCRECEQKEKERMQGHFEKYYLELLSILNKIRSSVEISSDAIAALDEIGKITDKLALCDTLRARIHDERYTRQILARIVRDSVFLTPNDRRLGHAYSEDWGIEIPVKTETHSFSGREILTVLDRLIDRLNQRITRTAYCIRRDADFQCILDSIPAAGVRLTDTPHPALTLACLANLKYSSITPKSDPERISTYVVIDTETTGLSALHDKIIELAAVRFEDWEPTDIFTTLINPRMNIPYEASAINHITDDMVNNAPEFSSVIDSLAEFVGDLPIVGHNLSFDLKFLHRQGYDFVAGNERRKYYDTLEIAKKLLRKQGSERYGKDSTYTEDYDVENYQLTTLCEYYGIRGEMFDHRAAGDALATGILFGKLAHKIKV